MTVINPYRMALSLVYRRLKWDMSYESYMSREKLRACYNKYTGEKCVILCNGPSLNKVDFEMLRNSGVYTIGLNKINLLFDRTDFRPSCIVAVNSHVIEQNKNFYLNTSIPVFLDSQASSSLARSKNITYMHSANVRGGFAQNCSWSVFQGNTVTYVALQLAFHYGFQEVAIVGCDHYFETKGTPNKLVSSGESDPNHFDSRYFSGGDNWQLPDLAESEIAYLTAKSTYEKFSRRIYNCTVGGRLEVFQRRSLSEFLCLKN